jgi:hypothetical protein
VRYALFCFRRKHFGKPLGLRSGTMMAPK